MNHQVVTYLFYIHKNYSDFFICLRDEIRFLEKFIKEMVPAATTVPTYRQAPPRLLHDCWTSLLMIFKCFLQFQVTGKYSFSEWTSFLTWTKLFSIIPLKQYDSSELPVSVEISWGWGKHPRKNISISWCAIVYMILHNFVPRVGMLTNMLRIVHYNFSVLLIYAHTLIRWCLDFPFFPNWNFLLFVFPWNFGML